MKKQPAKKIAKPKKEKPAYHFLQNTGYAFRRMWQKSHWLGIVGIAQIPIGAIIALLGSYLAAEVVRLVEVGASDAKLLFRLFLICGGVAFCGVSSILMNYKTELYYFDLNFSYLRELNRKTMEIDYALLESPHGQNLRSLAYGNVDPDDTYGSSNASLLPFLLIEMFGELFGILSYSAVITILNPFLILILLVSTIIPFLTTQWYNKTRHAHRTEESAMYRQFDYIGRNMSSREKAKDILYYHMTDWFLSVFWKIIDRILAWRGKYEKIGFFRVNLVSALLTLLQNGVAYAFLLQQVIAGEMTVSSFVFFFAIITGFSGWLGQFLNGFAGTLQASRQFCDLRTYLELPDCYGSAQEEALAPIPDGTFSITFEDVSFHYPPSEEDKKKAEEGEEVKPPQEILHNLSFTIPKGQKLALVGLNGAGKTTLVKLLCGLQKPTAGRILLNGKELSEYKMSEYTRAIAAVFQDFHLLPVSVEQNITLRLSEQTDNEKLNYAIEEAGLKEWISTLPHGKETLLGKSVRDGAIDLSGGQKQKLALARALYRGGQMMILDEPTAALDPVAENRMYLEYQKFIGGNTAIFISHRLSSTRFCDRILLLENGAIAEDGTHDELMEKGGSYAALFQKQAYYYQENISEPEAECV